MLNKDTAWVLWLMNKKEKLERIGTISFSKMTVKIILKDKAIK